MAKTLTSRKQEFVRDGIFEAAIDLFVRKGFQETTVDDVARAAGVSRRSFFRYFTTKDHLLGHNMVKLGDVLVAAVAASPAESSPNQVVHDAVMAGLLFATSHPRTRQVIEITSRNLSTRQAHSSRKVDVENCLAEAFAARTRHETKNDLRPRMLAILTLTVVDLSLVAWFRGDFDDCSKAPDHVFAMLTHVLNEPTETSVTVAAVMPNSKVPGATHRRQSVAR
jgi:AcrR family transcriptional regulator